MTLWAAIDGGNSKTDVIIGDIEGDILAFVRGPGSNPQIIGVGPAVALLHDLLHQARAEAGIAPLTLARAEVYLAGVDLPEEVDIVGTAVRERAWAAETRVDNDTFALMRAGTDEP